MTWQATFHICNEFCSAAGVAAHISCLSSLVFCRREAWSLSLTVGPEQILFLNLLPSVGILQVCLSHPHLPPLSGSDAFLWVPLGSHLASALMWSTSMQHTNHPGVDDVWNLCYLLAAMCIYILIYVCVWFGQASKCLGETLSWHWCTTFSGYGLLLYKYTYIYISHSTRP